MEVDDVDIMASDDASSASDDMDIISDIAPHGDVIMVVGPKKKEFRLHSLILKTASKVFKSMLGPNFAEGQQLVNNGSHNDPVKIKLPEDDAHSMGILFELIHYRTEALSGANIDTLFDVARAADKYDLILAVRYPAINVMDDDLLPYSKRGEEESMWKLALAAAIFNHCPVFKKATGALVMLSLDGYITLADKWYHDQVFALRLCGLLENQRAEFRRLMMHKLITACAWYSDEDNDPTQRTSDSTILRLDIKMDSPDNFANSDLAEALETMRLSDYYNQFRENARREADKDGYWIYDIEVKAGLKLSDMTD